MKKVIIDDGDGFGLTGMQRQMIYHQSARRHARRLRVTEVKTKACIQSCMFCEVFYGSCCQTGVLGITERLQKAAHSGNLEWATIVGLVFHISDNFRCRLATKHL